MLVYRQNQAGWSDVIASLPSSLHLPRGVWQLAINDTVSIMSYMDSNNQVGHVELSGDTHAEVKRALLKPQPETLNEFSRHTDLAATSTKKALSQFNTGSGLFSGSEA